MKNAIKQFGIITLTAVIGFTMAACGSGKNNDPELTKAVIAAEPSGGGVVSGTPITLTVVPAEAEIYYTLDGSMPSAFSAQYSDNNKPVITESALRLRAWAPKGDTWAESAVLDITYTIDNEAHTAHVWGAWLNDENRHWRKCTVCEEESSHDEHTIDEGVSFYCTVCNYLKIEYRVFTSIADVKTYLDSLSDGNTAATPYAVKLNMAGINATTVGELAKLAQYPKADLGGGLGDLSAQSKYVAFDLSGSTFAGNTIPADAFNGCAGLAAVTLPDGITSIALNAFRNTGLTSFTFPDSVKTIGNDAFRSCTNLTSITLSNSLISFGGSCFYNCNKLVEVTIPASVTGIGDYSFGHCESLARFIFEAGGISLPSMWCPVDGSLNPLYMGPNGGAGTYQHTPNAGDWKKIN